MPPPTVNYAGMYGRLGGQVAQLGGAVDETIGYVKAQQKLRDFRQDKEDYKTEVLGNMGPYWSDEQRKSFVRQLNAIDDPDEFEEKSREFGKQQILFEHAGYKGTVPHYGYSEEWYKARKGEEKTEAARGEASAFLGRATQPTVTAGEQPQRQVAGDMPTRMGVAGMPEEVEGPPAPVTEELAGPPEPVVEPVTSAGFAQQAITDLSPEALADPRIAMQAKVFETQERETESARKAMVDAAKDKEQQAIRRITTASGIDWRVGGNQSLMEIERDRITNKQRISDLQKLARERDLQKAIPLAASLGIKNDQNTIARELSLAQELDENIYPEMMNGIKEAMKQKAEAEKEKRKTAQTKAEAEKLRAGRGGGTDKTQLDQSRFITSMNKILESRFPPEQVEQDILDFAGQPTGRKQIIKRSNPRIKEIWSDRAQWEQIANDAGLTIPESMMGEQLPEGLFETLEAIPTEKPVTELGTVHATSAARGTPEVRGAAAQAVERLGQLKGKEAEAAFRPVSAQIPTQQPAPAQASQVEQMKMRLRTAGYSDAEIEQYLAMKGLK